VEGGIWVAGAGGASVAGEGGSTCAGTGPWVEGGIWVAGAGGASVAGSTCPGSVAAGISMGTQGAGATCWPGDGAGASPSMSAWATEFVLAGSSPGSPPAAQPLAATMPETMIAEAQPLKERMIHSPC
jgi:hypothetical protein